MKVLWVYFDIETGNQMHYNHGVGQVDACLRAAGHDTALTYLNNAPEESDVVRTLEEAKPDAVFFPINTHQWMFARTYADWVKKHSNAMTVFGGIHSILDPEQVIAHQSVDAVCIGEGELAATELMNALGGDGDLNTVEGMWVKSPSGKVHKNPFRHLIEDLDTLPVSDRTIWDYEKILVDSGYELTVMGGRGCPFHCYYCANSARRNIYRGHGKFVRMCSPKHLIGAIEKLEKRYNFGKIFIEDDVFIFKHKWAREFCERYKDRFNYPFQAYVRVEFCTKEILAAMRDAGCYRVLIGVEAGNEKLRREMLNRKMTNESIIQVFRWADELGLQTWNFNILGFPDETPDTVEDLFSLNRILRPNKGQISLFYPYPNTQLYDVCKERGLITGTERPTYFEQSILELPSISEEDLKESFWRFRSMALQFRAEKEAKGYLDFTTLLKDADVEADDPDHVKLTLMALNGLNEMTLFQHPRSIVTMQANVKPGSVFRSRIALDPNCFSWGGAGVRFRLEVENGKGPVELLNTYIDPKQNVEERRWHNVEIDLARFAGEDVIFRFITEPDEQGNLVGAWSGWGRPHLSLGKAFREIS